MQVGMVGLGRMGVNMARRLIRCGRDRQIAHRPGPPQGLAVPGAPGSPPGRSSRPLPRV